MRRLIDILIDDSLDGIEFTFSARRSCMPHLRIEALARTAEGRPELRQAYLIDTSYAEREVVEHILLETLERMATGIKSARAAAPKPDER